jgi:NAD(P)-dependent dehydrogenase (short-subunit alcohol dehydrogenase family)
MKGKIAMITGAGSGIGEQAALEFAARGATVAACDIDGSSAERVARQVVRSGGRAHAFRADVSSEQDVRATTQAIVERLGGLDFAFNNAGIIGPVGTPLHELTKEQWRRVIDVDLTSVWLCMKHQIPAMIERGSGSIVNNSSIVGLRAATFNPAYGAAKHGVVGLTRAAASFYANRRIRVNAICPGIVDTPMSALIDASPGKRSTARVERTPMLRSAEAIEIARVAAWLCSDDASYITGVALPVDGGNSVV